MVYTNTQQWVSTASVTRGPSISPTASKLKLRRWTCVLVRIQSPSYPFNITHKHFQRLLYLLYTPQRDTFTPPPTTYTDRRPGESNVLSFLVRVFQRSRKRLMSSKQQNKTRVTELASSTTITQLTLKARRLWLEYGRYSPQHGTRIPNTIHFIVLGHMATQNNNVNLHQWWVWQFVQQTPTTTCTNHPLVLLHRLEYPVHAQHACEMWVCVFYGMYLVVDKLMLPHQTRMSDCLSLVSGMVHKNDVTDMDLPKCAPTRANTVHKLACRNAQSCSAQQSNAHGNTNNTTPTTNREVGHCPAVIAKWVYLLAHIWITSGLQAWMWHYNEAEGNNL